MGEHTDYQYHIDRARMEIACAIKAEAQTATAAHIKLSLLHMERARSAKAWQIAASFPWPAPQHATLGAG